MAGKFIVFYGTNNLGKTTQAKLLTDRLNNENKKTEYLKYPVYDIKPSGELLNNYLRKGNNWNLTPRESQIIYMLNRIQYQKKLKEIISKGINIIAEDYTGTGIAWGIGAGVNKKFLKKINADLMREDLAFLFDGERFKKSIEKNHKHETDQNLTDKVREAHLKLLKECGWIKINANLNLEKIHEIIYNRIIKIIK